MQIKLNNKKRVINFHFQPKNQLVKLLAEQLNVLSFEALKFFGSIQQVSSSRWELSGILNFKVTQELLYVFLVSYNFRNKRSRMSRKLILKRHRHENVLAFP